MSSGFEVIKAGAFTLIEDKGRFSFMNIGVTNSGFLDEFAALKAHKILNNSYDCNLLEITFAGIKLKATANTIVSITGAKCEFKINSIEKSTWQSYNIKKDDILEITKILKGQRVYLAVKDGFTITKELGSYSTTLKEQLGAFEGRVLKNGDYLPFSEQKNFLKKRLKKEYIPEYKDELVLRVVLSYQQNSFSFKEKEKFFNSIYTITPDLNRMACKLSGESIKSELNGIISEGIAFGAIQIPKDGQPIILLKERQTIGGYPKIGSVLSIDCFKLAQMRPGQKIRFEEISISLAQEKLKKFYSNFIQ
ncbi:biotin-dependent carboxyltransferase family protein [Halarcobacter ebronensis]|uniref:Urea amidolyase n=1 Tax=Halarcobacter ebronensis TaxID=1462615 RepID=A0A4Q1ARB5_9BACT|nr:biotin-dependent carboxyltransferase family protein [Halarcobacter ebronensis]QKF81589.1 allophanate hydrolase, subunit 2 [Halarcobacter ebronensis]RXK05517.1 urea amidolyase [Halarcobacter ebronensis]